MLGHGCLGEFALGEFGVDEEGASQGPQGPAFGEDHLHYVIRHIYEEKRRKLRALEEQLRDKEPPAKIAVAAEQVRDDVGDEFFTVLRRLNVVEQAGQDASARLAALQILYDAQIALAKRRDDEDAIIVILLSS